MTRSAVAEVVARATGRAVAGIGRLQGGISNLTYLVRLRDGDPSGVVARVFEDPERAHREAAALRILARRDMPAPRLLGLHALSGHRRVLIETRVPGRPVARPDDPDWLGTLAAALADVHSLVPPEPGLAIDPGGDRAWLDDAPHAPLGPAARMIWPALGRRRHELATGRPVLTHGDFHAGNVHWSRGRLAAVLD